MSTGQQGQLSLPLCSVFTTALVRCRHLLVSLHRRFGLSYPEWSGKVHWHRYTKDIRLGGRQYYRHSRCRPGRGSRQLRSSRHRHRSLMQHSTRARCRHHRWWLVSISPSCVAKVMSTPAMVGRVSPVLPSRSPSGVPKP